MIFGVVALIVAGLCLPREAQAAIVDLTTVASSGFINGAFFKWTDFDQNATGSGVVQPFVRIQHDPTEQGYNTSGRPLTLWPDVHTDATFTHSLLLSSVPIVTIGGIPYREFLLDIGEPGGNLTFLSLDQLQIFLNNSGSITGTLASLGVPLYNLDTLTVDNYIKLRASLNPGNGKGDMFAYIPNSIFSAASDSDFVYLYSQFGSNFPSNGSFEEWSICPQPGGCLAPPIPEPSSLTLLGAGLLGLLKRNLKRRR